MKSRKGITMKTWTIADGITAIRCPAYISRPGSWGYVLSYLVCGEEQTLLLDTGYGNFDLKSAVEIMTPLPLVVVNSHLHPDHSMGNGQFDKVLVGEHEYDREEGFFFPAEALEFPLHPSVLAGGGYRFDFLKHGDEINLGNRTLTVLEIPGHTEGSIALFDAKSKLLLGGDSILKRVLYAAGVPFSQYAAALERVKTVEPAAILSSHWPQPLDVGQIDRLLMLVRNFDPALGKGTEGDNLNASPMRVISQGRDISDPDFAAIVFSMDQVEQIMQ